MYRFLNFLSTFLERVHFLAFCEHEGWISSSVLYVGWDGVLADLALSVSAAAGLQQGQVGVGVGWVAAGGDSKIRRDA